MVKIEEPLGEIGTEVLMENERVKVWNLLIEPGQRTSWHRHDLDYVIVVTEGTTLQVTFDDGRVEDRDYKLGDICFFPRSTHYVANTGNSRYQNVIIELKK